MSGDGRFDTTVEMAELRQNLQALGYFERPTSVPLGMWIAHVGVGLSAFVVLLTARDAWLLRAVAFAIGTFSLLCAATIGHTASHGALARPRAINQLVLYVTYPLLLGMSARYWVKSHVVIHHPTPNRVGVDRDCDLRPFFALNEVHVDSRWSVVRSYRRLQGFLLPLLLPLNGFGIQLQSWRALLRELRERPRLRAVADAGCLAAHLTLFVIVPSLWLGPAVVLPIHALRVAVLGIALFAILAPGHYPEEAACLGPGVDADDFALKQVVTTVNFRTGPLGRLLCNGLEYQIEHHLFPAISHVHLPNVSPLVRDFCARTGLPYRTLSWPHAIWESYRVFFSPKRVHQSVAALGLPAREPPTVSTLTRSRPPEGRVA
jgi:fatty acid desaturase